MTAVVFLPPDLPNCSLFSYHFQINLPKMQVIKVLISHLKKFGSGFLCSYKRRFKLLILIIIVFMIFALCLALNPLIGLCFHQPRWRFVGSWTYMLLNTLQFLHPLLWWIPIDFLKPQFQHKVSCDSSGIDYFCLIIPCAYFLYRSCETYGTCVYFLFFLLDYWRDCILSNFVFPCPAEWMAQR